MKRFAFLILIVLYSSVTFATTNLLVYDQMALVSSNATIENGKNSFVIPTPNGAIPESLVISSSGSYEYHAADSYTLEYLLKRFLGTTVQFEFTSNSTAVVKNVRILSSNPIIIQTIDGGKVYFSPSGQFIFPSLPQIDSQNYFQVSTKASSLSYSYLTNGIGWKAYYVLNIDDNVMDGKIELWNKTDMSFRNFNLAILSGAPFTSNNLQPMAKALVMNAPSAPLPSTQNVESYKIYTYGKVDKLDANSTIFLPLFSRSVKVEKLNTIYNPSQNFSNAIQMVRIFHDFAIPAGEISLYTKKDGMTYFLGQSHVTDTASGIALDLQYGQDFDLSANSIEIERTVVTKDLYNHVYQITVVNSSSKAEELWIYISIPSDAIITAIPEHVKFERPSTTQIRFFVDIRPNSKEVFTYGLQTNY